VQNTISLPTDVLFDDQYPYLSSVSRMVRENAAELAARLAGCLPNGARALEIGSNDGTAQVALAAHGILCLGVDPAATAVAHARDRGCFSYCRPFDAKAVEMVLAMFGSVDAVLMSNVLAHVPEPVKMLAAVREVLAPGGLVVIEVQSWRSLVARGAFDMVYHEHHAHFSLGTILRLLERTGFAAVDMQETSAQGGSIRLWCRVGSDHDRAILAEALIESEELEGAQARLGAAVATFRADAGEFRRKQSGRIVAGFGAAAKTVTLLATCESDLDIICVADNATSKIGRYLPIFSVPIVSPEVMMAHDPDAIVLFAWNLAEEIVPTLPGREIWAPFPRFRRLA